jgi:glycosyltransferase involved in cell wall biosynthesis
MRIAHFTLGRTNPEAADGIDKTVYYLSRTQAEMGHSVRLFSITNKPPIPVPGARVSTYPAIQPSRLLFTRRLRNLLAWRSPFNLPARLVGDLLAWQPDVLHLHGVHISQNVLLGRRARQAGIPYCVTVHGMLARAAQRRRRWLKRTAALLERPFLDRASFVHAVSTDEVDDLRAYGTKAPIVIAPNAIDAQGLATAALPGPDTHRWTASDERLEFVFLGRLDPDQKGLDLLLDGFARAGLREPHLTLIGPSWRESRATLEALSSRLGIGPQVAFTGPLYGPDKIRRLAEASVFVQTSRWEGLSFSLLEAAALGKPALLTSAADPQGSFARAEAAVVVAPAAESIAAGLQRFARMPVTERLEMGRRARALVEREFSWPATAATVIDAYRTLALRHQPS